MTQLSVKEIWRYPVKSMRGEMLREARLTRGGVAGDRIWVVRGEGGEKIADRKNALAGLLSCSARYDDAADEVEITLPDGRTIMLADGREAEVAAALSPVVGGRTITLQRAERGPLGAADAGDPGVVEGALKRFCKPRADDPPFPDLARYPAASIDGAMQYLKLFVRRDGLPPPHGFDLFPVNVLTEASLRWLSRKLGKPADMRRFRPNFLIADGANAADRIEFAWEGKEVAFGESGASIFGVVRCERCVMPSLAQGGVGADLGGDAAFNPANSPDASYLATYAVVAHEGRVAAGDAVRVLGA
jgi:hypothetical protein